MNVKRKTPNLMIYLYMETNIKWSLSVLNLLQNHPSKMEPFALIKECILRNALFRYFTRIQQDFLEYNSH